MKKILIACERSQAVTKAFRELGFQAFSNDIDPEYGGHPEWHLQGDMFEIAKTQAWDLIIAHPPCTYLTSTGLRWLYSDKTKSEPHPNYPNRKQDQLDAVEFVRAIWDLPCDNIVIENPVGVLSTQFMKPSQIIQPFNFGENASKKTCLWVKGLPLLQNTNTVECEYVTTKTGKRFDRWYWETSKFKGKERQVARSKTFDGIAVAMAKQWGEYIVGN